MNSKIKDLVEIAAAPERARVRSQAPIDVLSAVLLTYELGDTLSRTVERLTGGVEGPPNCLVVGGPGCGKSTLMSAAMAILEVGPESDLHQRFAEIRSTVSERPFVVRVPSPDHERRFALAVERAVAARLAEIGLAAPGAADDLASDPKLGLLAQLAEKLPPMTRLVIAVDDLERWLRVEDAVASENLQAVSRLGELSKSRSVSACIVAEEDALNPASSLAPGRDWLSTLLRNFRIEYVSAQAVRTATASRILRKSARQRHEIQQVLEELREKLPELTYSDAEFIELYPLEVSTWTIGGHLHRWIEEFSFPEFAARAAESVKGRPGRSLFALNDMFSLYEPQLRRSEALEPIFAAYDRLVREALPSIGQAQRLWARLALQSIFMHTIAGIAVDVKTLTNSVLLYDLHGGGSSYTLMAAVLKQLEALGREQLLATGSAFERKYSLVSGRRDALLASVDEIAREIEDEVDLAWVLLRFGREHFADWPFGPSAADGAQADLWEIERGARSVSLRARSFDGDDGSALAATDPGAARPRLVIFQPGRPWSEARDEATRQSATACWTGAVPMPGEWELLKRWVAVSRLARSRRSKRFIDLDALRNELRERCAAAFRRIYIDAGVLVTAERSDAVHALLSAERDENLVVRLLAGPAATRAGVLPVAEMAVAAVAAPAATAATPPAPEPLLESFEGVVLELDEQASWLLHLLAASRADVASLREAGGTDKAFLKRLEAWYGERIKSHIPAALRLLGEGGASGETAAFAQEAKQQFDAVLYYVRRALSTGDLGGLGESISRIFETPERLWEARECLEELEEFGAWVPALEEAARYLREAEPMADGDLEELRKALLAKLDRPHLFADRLRRVTFGDAFGTYRAQYAQAYIAEHNGAVGFEVIHRLNRTLVESEMWQTLEALSSLSIGNPSYLVDAINLLSVLVDSKCDADVEEELQRRPICTCGFRLADRGRVHAMASSATQFVHTGVEYHRRLLHARQADIVSKLKANKQNFDVETMKAIAELTKDGPLPKVDDRVIDALNELLRS